MAAYNDITGDKIATRGKLSKEGEDNFERIFGVKKKKPYVPPTPIDAVVQVTQVSWGDEASEKRQDIIGQNGPTGEHYDE